MEKLRTHGSLSCVSHVLCASACYVPGLKPWTAGAAASLSATRELRGRASFDHQSGNKRAGDVLVPLIVPLIVPQNDCMASFHRGLQSIRDWMTMCRDRIMLPHHGESLIGDLMVASQEIVRVAVAILISAKLADVFADVVVVVLLLLFCATRFHTGILHHRQGSRPSRPKP